MTDIETVQCKISVYNTIFKIVNFSNFKQKNILLDKLD